MTKTLPLIALAAMLAVPALAQTATTTTTTDQTLYEKGLNGPRSPNAPAVNATEAPVTQQLNATVAAADNTAATDKTQYEADRQAYMNALVAHDAAVNRSDARYVRQQAAYADAMQAWRVQTRACKKGYKRACDAPTPNPADFYDRP